LLAIATEPKRHDFTQRGSLVEVLPECLTEIIIEIDCGIEAVNMDVQGFLDAKNKFQEAFMPRFWIPKNMAHCYQGCSRLNARRKDWAHISIIHLQYK
jgi:hypothetical protein